MPSIRRVVREDGMKCSQLTVNYNGMPRGYPLPLKEDVFHDVPQPVAEKAVRLGYFEIIEEEQPAQTGANIEGEDLSLLDPDKFTE